LFRLPAVTGGQVRSIPARLNEKQMGVGVTAMAVNAATPRGMRVVGVVGADVTVSASQMFQRRLVSRRQLMQIRREHEVRDGYQH